MRKGAYWKVVSLGLVGSVVGTLTACSGSDEPKPVVSSTSEATNTKATEVAPASPEAPVAAKGRSVKEENDLYEFAFSYPDSVAAVPELKSKFDADLEKSKADLIASATEAKADAQKGDYPYNTHSASTEWTVVTNLPDWLSLTSGHSTYSGGAHGMSYSDSLLWDRRSKVMREVVDLFTSPDALRAAIQVPFCDILDKQRAKKRDEPVVRGSGQMFSECIDPVAQTLILGSSNGKTFNRIGILVGPYEAGPYAEGDYEVTLPVTGNLMATLKPQYRSSFSTSQ